MRYVAARWLALAAAVTTTAALAAPAPAEAAAALPAPVVRVNQVGYAPGSPKVAFAMLPRHGEPASASRSSAAGGVVFRGRSADDVGRWNASYRGRLPARLLRAEAARQLPDRRSPAAPSRRVARRSGSPGRPQLYHGWCATRVRYFTSERDGARRRALGPGPPAGQPHRPARLRLRRPALRQQRQPARQAAPGSAARSNVAGGWFDAGGGYEKFAYTASYADGLHADGRPRLPRPVPDAAARRPTSA